MNQDWINALIGGALIGISVSLMLLWSGRVTGISGIVNGVMGFVKGDILWRLTFVLGLFFGGLIMKWVRPEFFAGQLPNQTSATVVAGLLVGFGTIMGSGCTSGHGVCGISRMSPRSLVATGTFILAGVIAVYIFRKWGLIP